MLQVFGTHRNLRYNIANEFIKLTKMSNHIKKQLTHYFQEHPDGIACVYLFGSQARRQSRPASDVDVAVLYKNEVPGGFDGFGIPLAGELEKLISKPVDVIVLNNANVDLIHKVLRDGNIIFESDRDIRIQFEVKSRNAYFDLKPYLDEYRRVG